ncbi:uncharacterized protein LOC135946495 [Cloeon dipterum]|uniref:uncharacterized protein LOC135946495 n=1 Tax=Cloeon dipterum TaxID=197152 RepID=UPI00321FA334
MAAVAAAAPTQPQQQFVAVMHCFQEQGDEFWPCLKQRALTLMDDALTLENVSLVEGMVTLERDPRHVQHTESSLDLANLPSDPEFREQRLNDLLLHRALAFIESSSVRIKLPSQQAFEGRVKKFKKMAVPMLIVLSMVVLAALAMKAVVISKVALAIVSWIFLKKFLNGGQKKEKFEIIAKHPEHHDSHYHHEASNHLASVQSPYGRYYDAHTLAFQAQQPEAAALKATQPAERTTRA